MKIRRALTQRASFPGWSAGEVPNVGPCRISQSRGRGWFPERGRLEGDIRTICMSHRAGLVWTYERASEKNMHLMNPPDRNSTRETHMTKGCLLRAQRVHPYPRRRCTCQIQGSGRGVGVAWGPPPSTRAVLSADARNAVVGGNSNDSVGGYFRVCCLVPCPCRGLRDHRRCQCRDRSRYSHRHRRERASACYGLGKCLSARPSLGSEGESDRRTCQSGRLARSKPSVMDGGGGFNTSTRTSRQCRFAVPLSSPI